MHSDLDQAQRDETMMKFRNNHISVLVATDIISRGIDIDDIELVVNYDAPADPEDYIHRIGRTARAGRGGESLTLVCLRDRQRFRNIEKLIGKKVEVYPLPEGMEAVEERVRKKDGQRRGRKEGRKSSYGKGGGGKGRRKNGKGKAQNEAKGTASN